MAKQEFQVEPYWSLEFAQNGNFLVEVRIAKKAIGDVDDFLTLLRQILKSSFPDSALDELGAEILDRAVSALSSVDVIGQFDRIPWETDIFVDVAHTKRQTCIYFGSRIFQLADAESYQESHFMSHANIGYAWHDLQECFFLVDESTLAQQLPQYPFHKQANAVMQRYFNQATPNHGIPSQDGTVIGLSANSLMDAQQYWRLNLALNHSFVYYVPSESTQTHIDFDTVVVTSYFNVPRWVLTQQQSDCTAYFTYFDNLSHNEFLFQMIPISDKWNEIQKLTQA